jgi:hypothetical protein
VVNGLAVFGMAAVAVDSAKAMSPKHLINNISWIHLLLLAKRQQLNLKQFF